MMTCASVCNAGFENCDGDATNGCEANLGTNPNHCGACGVACAAGRICRSGTCAAANRVLISDGYGSADLRGYLTGWCYTVTVVPGATLNSTFDYAPYDIVAFMFDSTIADPARLIAQNVAGRVGIVLQDQQSFAGPECPGAFLLQPQRLAVEPPVGLDIADAQPHADLGDALMAGRNQGDAIALRIGQGGGRGQALARNQQFAVAARRRVRQRRGVVVDLQYAAEEIVPVLVLSTADRQQVVERHAGCALPEGEHGFQVVGGESDVEPGLGEMHGFLTCTLSLPVELVTSNKRLRKRP